MFFIKKACLAKTLKNEVNQSTKNVWDSGKPTLWGTTKILNLVWKQIIFQKAPPAILSYMLSLKASWPWGRRGCPYLSLVTYNSEVAGGVLGPRTSDLRPEGQPSWLGDSKSRRFCSSSLVTGAFINLFNQIILFASTNFQSGRDTWWDSRRPIRWVLIGSDESWLDHFPSDHLIESDIHSGERKAWWRGDHKRIHGFAPQALIEFYQQGPLYSGVWDREGIIGSWH